MSFRLLITAEAEADLAEGFGWYEGKEEGLGFEFLHAVKSVFHDIQLTPERFPEVHKGTRRALVRRFPFKIFFLIDKDIVEIFAVLHASRNPETWKHRSR